MDRSTPRPRLKTLGPYRIERRLAAGGMAEVFVAQRLGPHEFAKRVALKCILPQHANDPDFVAMFIDEARLAALLDHPSIVQVFDFGEAEGELFLAMELVDGTNVNKLLRAVSSRAETVPLIPALHIASEAARALAYAHQAIDDKGECLHLVHRDVSPANLLVTKRGHVKLSDFGIARCTRSDHRTDEGHVRGKLGYMSPEQVLGRPVDGKSDVFTLGTVLSEMLIGEPLFSGGTELDALLKIRNADLSALDRRPRNIPQDVRALLERVLNRRAPERPTAVQFADALDEIIHRRGTGRGAQELARLLYRLDLIEYPPQDVDASEPGARPTSFVELEEISAQTASNTRELLSSLTLDSPNNWEVVLANGKSIGPIQFPELVRRIIAGEVDRTAQVRHDAGELQLTTATPELRRYFGSKALCWDVSDIEEAERYGRITPGSVLSVVHEITSQHQTGVLHLWDDKRKKKVYFASGRPDFVGSTVQSEMLGEYLVSRGICLRMEVQMALALLPRFNGRLGDALVGLGVLRPVELYRAVTAQVRERYLEIFRWRAGEWAFRENILAQEETFPMEQGAYELLCEAAQAADPMEIEAALANVREKVVQRETRPPAPIGAYSMPDPWKAMLTRVEGDRTLASIVAKETANGQDVEDVYRAFYLGLSCQLVKAA